MPTHLSLRRLPSALILCLAALLLAGPPSVRGQDAPDLDPYTMIDQWPERGAAEAGVLQDPVALDVAADEAVYIADADLNAVHVVAPDGKFMAPFGATGDGPERLAGIRDLSVARDDEILYVADPSSKRVVVYDLGGRFVRAWGGIDPATVAAAPSGRVFVGDRETNQIVAFDVLGREQLRFGSPGLEDGQFTGIIDASVSWDGAVLAVADTAVGHNGNGFGRVQLFDLADAGPRFRRSYEFYKSAIYWANALIGCGAFSVSALGGDTILVPNCRITGPGIEGLNPTVGSTMAGGTVCGNRLKLFRAASENGPFVAVGTYDPNLGPCRAKLTSLPTSPAVVRFNDADFRIAKSVDLARANSYEDRTLQAPQGVDTSVPGSVFVEDLSSRTRLFLPTGEIVTTTARVTGMGNAWQEVYRSTYTGVPGEIIGQYRQWRKNALGAWQEGYGIGRFRATRKLWRERQTIDVLEPVWIESFACRVDRSSVSYFDGCEIVDLVYSARFGAAFALVVKQSDTGVTNWRDIQLWRLPADSGVPKKIFTLPKLQIGQFDYNPYLDLEAGADGLLHLLDDVQDRAQALDAEGHVLGSVPVHADVRRIAVDDQGRVFGLRTAGFIERYEIDGRLSARFDARPLDGSDPSSITGLDVDEQGRVFVSDGQSSLISVYAPGRSTEGPDIPADATCNFAVDKSALPQRLPLGERTRLDLAIQGRCGPGAPPTDVMIIFPKEDESRAINLRRVVARFDLGANRLGLISHEATARLERELTNDLSALDRTIARWPKPQGGDGREQGLAVAIGVADRALRGVTDPGRQRVMVILDSGCKWASNVLDRCAVELEKANQARAAGIRVMVATSNSGSYYYYGESALADSDADVVAGPEAIALRATRPRVPANLATAFTLTDTLPANMRLLPGSISAPGTAVGAGVVWQLPTLDYPPPTFTLEVEPQAAGSWPTNVEAVAEFTDGWGKAQRLVFPIPEVEVYAPTPTPAEPTPTEAPTATATPHPPTAAPTATLPPVTARPIYLPWLARASCRPAAEGLAVALVVDSSSSMAGEKLAAAQAALRTFVDSLLRGSARNRAALLSFDAAARQHTGLTADRSHLEAAVAALRTADGTRIDLGLAAGVQALAGAAGRPVLILLSDGRQDDAAAVRAAAERARAAGVEVWAIGLGTDVDGALLASVASDAAHYLVAPGPADLAALYERIAAAIPCR